MSSGEVAERSGDVRVLGYKSPVKFEEEHARLMAN
jgi:hypothetical protein